jgi:ABC-type dipeptide/oligopeptide/nickel transport system permease component
MEIAQFIGRRLLSAVPTLFGLLVIAFVLANYLPGDPLARLLGDRGGDDPQLRAAYEREWGLDKPPLERFWTYLTNLSQGNLGTSTLSRRPVSTDLAEYLPATIELAVFAILVAGVLGLTFGVLAAFFHNRWPDATVRAVALLASGVPVFWLGLVGLQLFYVNLRLLPGPEGRLSSGFAPPTHITGAYTLDALLTGDWVGLGNALWHLILPSIVLGSFFLGLLARITRASTLEVLRAPYLVTARAKGLRRRTTMWFHILPNVLIPTVTVLGLAVGGLLAGAVLTETVFSWPGIGRYAVDAAKAVDFQAILGVTILIGFIYVITNAVVDVIYGLLDPRIRVGGRR